MRRLVLCSALPFYDLDDKSFRGEFSNHPEDSLLRLESFGVRDCLLKLTNNDTFKNLDCAYYTADEFNSKFTKQLSSLSIFHLNIRSLNCNNHALVRFLRELRLEFDVLVLSEV